MSEKIRFINGDFGENLGYEIERNYKISEKYDSPCIHCKKNSDNEDICPNVIIAYNEGGFNCTITCIDCVIENFNKGAV